MSYILNRAVVLTLIQVVLFFGLHSVEADFSDNCVNSTDSLTCIRTYEELYNRLAKSDNSFNIESALYPAKKPSSVRVFVNVYGPNETEADIAQYTWSISCLYAAVPALVLEVLSLGSILVTPRTQTLDITIPHFCCNVSKMEDERRKKINEMIEGVLAALQDLAVKPGLRDPRLNNAECVIEGHKPDIKATGRSHHIRAILWCSGWFVLVACPLLSSLIEQYRQKAWPEKSEDKKDNNQDATGSLKNTDSQVQNTDSEENKEMGSRVVSKTNTAKAVCILCFVLAVLGSIILITSLGLTGYYIHKDKSPPDIIIVVLLIFSESFVVFCCRRKNLADVSKYSFVYGTTCANVTSYCSCWMLIGIMLNPTWGLTVTLIICFSFAAFTYAVYTYLTETERKLQAGLLCVCGVLAVIFLAFVIVFAGQSYNGRETADETLKTALLSALGAFVSWLSWKRFVKVSQDSAEEQNYIRQSPSTSADTGQTPPGENGDSVELQRILLKPSE